MRGGSAFLIFTLPLRPRASGRRACGGRGSGGGVSASRRHAGHRQALPRRAGASHPRASALWADAGGAGAASSARPRPAPALPRRAFSPQPTFCSQRASSVRQASSPRPGVWPPAPAGPSPRPHVGGRVRRGGGACRAAARSECRPRSCGPLPARRRSGA